MSLLISVAMLGSVAGCGASSCETKEAAEETGEDSQEPSFGAAKLIPDVLIDQLGYESLSEKAIVFRGKELPESFGIYDDKGNPVYTGEIFKSVYNSELDEYDSLGFFNDYDREGEFYAGCEGAGRSFTFVIKNDIYGDIFKSACRSCYSEGTKDAVSLCRIAENLLLASELNPGAFLDSTGNLGSSNGIPDVLDEVSHIAEELLKLQDMESGGIYGEEFVSAPEEGVLDENGYYSPVSAEATIAFAGTMAMFASEYAGYDEGFSAACLDAAKRAFSCFEGSGEGNENTERFRAASYLYKATGDAAYSLVMDEYFKREDFGDIFNSDEAIFMGAVNYLTINRSVDIDICRMVMKNLMKRAEDIARRSSESPYLVSRIPQDGDFLDMLLDMRCLTITDHIIYNHEYTTIIENHVHFLGGMNPEAVNYITADTERNFSSLGADSLLDDPELTSLFVFMLSILENK